MFELFKFINLASNICIYYVGIYVSHKCIMLENIYIITLYLNNVIVVFNYI